MSIQHQELISSLKVEGIMSWIVFAHIFYSEQKRLACAWFHHEAHNRRQKIMGDCHL
jgi:hypothetical protein